MSVRRQARLSATGLAAQTIGLVNRAAYPVINLNALPGARDNPLRMVLAVLAASSAVITVGAWMFARGSDKQAGPLLSSEPQQRSLESSLPSHCPTPGAPSTSAGTRPGHFPCDDQREATSTDESYPTAEPSPPHVQQALSTSRPAANLTPPDVVRCDDCTPPADIKSRLEQGAWLRHRADAFNEKAARLIFEAHNDKLVNPRAGPLSKMAVDLHMQYPHGAARYVKEYIHEARERGLEEVTFIVGVGKNSKNHESKLRPSIERMLKDEMHMEFWSPIDNPGRIVVKIA